MRAWRAGDAEREAARSTDEKRQVGEPAGLAARRLAVELIETVIVSSRALDDALDVADRDPRFRQLEGRDRGFARLIAATVLRRLGSLDAVLARYLERPIPLTQPRPRSILLAGAAQILIIGTPAHAAINLAVEQCRRDPKAERFDKLTNAVLRRVASQGTEILDGLDTPRIDIPGWLWERWVGTYGEAIAGRIATASLAEAPLDLTVKADPAEWAKRLGGELLATGTVRLKDAGRVEELPGFKEGAWWVQDAAAALPARLFGDVRGLEVADLCAAPGGKTAALAVAGARITAVDQSADRLARLEQNVERLGLVGQVRPVLADLLDYSPERSFDHVLLDAPCLSTGTIRRHPDLLHLKRVGDLGRIAELQGKLIARAARWVKPGGRLVYCVCSVEPEEGEQVVAAFLGANPDFTRKPIVPSEICGSVDWVTRAGDLRTLPFHEASPGQPGMDGFYAARFVRAG
ncbi:MAG: RsmB/NOP family class I SAM-dependent RNA methyltransferase [Hyphomicrobiaceae bacterium]